MAEAPYFVVIIVFECHHNWNLYFNLFSHHLDHSMISFVTYVVALY